MNTDNTTTTLTFTPDGDLAGTTTDNIDYKAMYESQREKSERLENVIAAGRLAPVQPVSGSDRKPAVTAERLKAMLGPVGFVKASRNEKLIGLGLNPAEISDDTLKRAFGRGNDGKLSGDLMKSNPYRYRQLKEAAKILDIYGA